MNFLSKMERKFGRYAIKNLPLIMIILLVAGYTLRFIAPSAANYYAFIPEYIMRGQVWRLISWVLMPPTTLDIFTVIMLLFYYWVARTLAETWGDFFFNVYIFGGIILTDIGMMITYAILNNSLTTAASTGAASSVYMEMVYMPAYVTPYYILTSILIAYALTYPNMQVLLYFFIPVKMSWMGVLYAVFVIYDFIRAGMIVPRVVIGCALLNFALYFLMTSDLRKISPSELARKARFRRASRGSSAKDSGLSGMFNKKPGEKGPYANGNAHNATNPNRKSFNSGYTKVNPGGTRHRCTICGRTELDDPNLEFRFCSKCEGNYEYCNDHLFTHKHIKNGVPTDGPL